MISSSFEGGELQLLYTMWSTNKCLYELLTPALAAPFPVQGAGQCLIPTGAALPYLGTQLRPQGPVGRVWSVLDRRQGHIRDADLARRVMETVTLSSEVREKAVILRNCHWIMLMAFPAPGWWELRWTKRALSHPRFLCPIVCLLYAPDPSMVLWQVALLEWLFTCSSFHFISIGTAVFWVFSTMTLAEVSCLCGCEHGCVCL